MVKGNTNGFDITLKCISMMLQKAILVLAEDYLWFTYKCEIKNMEIIMILRKNGKFSGLMRNDCQVLQCNLPYLKYWMESKSNKIDDESSSENTDPSDNQKDKVDNGSENTEMGDLVVESDRNEGVNVTRDGDKKVLGEAVLVKSIIIIIILYFH